jgi:hypothetical protein
MQWHMCCCAAVASGQQCAAQSVILGHHATPTAQQHSTSACFSNLQRKKSSVSASSLPSCQGTNGRNVPSCTFCSELTCCCRCPALSTGHLGDLPQVRARHRPVHPRLQAQGCWLRHPGRQGPLHHRDGQGHCRPLNSCHPLAHSICNQRRSSCLLCMSSCLWRLSSFDAGKVRVCLCVCVCVAIGQPGAGVSEHALQPCLTAGACTAEVVFSAPLHLHDLCSSFDDAAHHQAKCLFW